MAHTIQGGRTACAPMFVTQQRAVRDFLADQDRLATIHADWLYQLASPEGKQRILREHGFALTPVRAARTQAALA